MKLSEISRAIRQVRSWTYTGYQRVNTLHTSFWCLYNGTSCINSLRLGDTYVRRWAGSPLAKAIDQSHRYGRLQAACREPAGSYDKTTRTAICFEHKTQYILIRAPYIPALWYFGTSVIYPPWFRWVKLVVKPHVLYSSNICEILLYTRQLVVKPWANLRCSGCYPLGEKLLWNRSYKPCCLFGTKSIPLPRQTFLECLSRKSHFNVNNKYIFFTANALGKE